MAIIVGHEVVDLRDELGDAGRTLAAPRQLAISGVSDRARYYDDCRRKRNVAGYDVAGGVSDTEATALLHEAERLAGSVRDWLRRERPELMR